MKYTWAAANCDLGALYMQIGNLEEAATLFAISHRLYTELYSGFPITYNINTAWPSSLEI